MFSKASAAVTSDDTQPVPIGATNIDYTEEDEKAIVDFTRNFGKRSSLFFHDPLSHHPLDSHPHTPYSI